ncbi:MAG TPA: hypothetical protein VLB04_13520 [Methanotrichaceae archaeon]|nr:hypothetical protein [Methanotrichaceae archaeon]
MQERVLRSYQEYVEYIHDQQDEEEVKDKLRKAAASKNLRTVVVDFRDKD